MKMHFYKKAAALLLASCTLLTGCGAKPGSSAAKPAASSGYTALPGLDTATPVTIKIAIPYETNKALNTVSNAFMAQYPNVSVLLEYVEDYDTNALQLFQAGSFDMILQKDVPYEEYTVKKEGSDEKVPTGKTTDDYFYNLAADTEIDFSHTTPDISDNYRHTRTDAAGQEVIYQYSYPLGGETRGIFVNKTLLDQYGLSIPTNYDELLNCCATLKENGLLPIQGGSDTASYGLGMAPAANTLVHDAAALEAMRNAEPGASAVFEGVLAKLYTLATSRYFDYKAAEADGYFKSTNELGQAESFLGLRTDETTFEITKPENNCGYAAFWPYISSAETVVHSLIEEYGLDTEVAFICSPLNDAGENSPPLHHPLLWALHQQEQRKSFVAARVL